MNWWKIRLLLRNFRRLLVFAVPKGTTPPNFAEKIFVNSHKTVKVTKVFSLQSFPPYGLCQYPQNCESHKGFLPPNIWFVWWILMHTTAGVTLHYVHVMFNLDPPGTICLKYWDPLWKMCSHWRQPHEDKSVHVSCNTVVTVVNYGVHSGVSRKLNGWFPSVDMQHSQKLRNVSRNDCSVGFRWEWGYSTLCAAAWTCTPE